MPSHEIVAHVLLFGRPDVLGQPAHQWLVIGVATQQVHRGVSVQVYQAGDEHVLAERTQRARPVAAARLVRRQQIGDTPVLHGNGVMFEYHAGRLDRDDPAGLDQQVDVGLGFVALHGGRIRLV